MNKDERKSQNSLGLFKIKARSKYLQDVARSYLGPGPLYILIVIVIFIANH